MSDQSVPSPGVQLVVLAYLDAVRVVADRALGGHVHPEDLPRVTRWARDRLDAAVVLFEHRPPRRMLGDVRRRDGGA